MTIEIFAFMLFVFLILCIAWLIGMEEDIDEDSYN